MEIICVLACLVLIACGIYGLHLYASGPKPGDSDYIADAMWIGLSPMLLFIGLMVLLLMLFP